MNQAILYLVTMVAVAPIAKRLGLGAVLGYLIAGAVLGPHALSWVGGTPEARESVLHLAEFGVIMMLFLIGLELKPALLWKLRGEIFGTGTLQVLSTTLVGMGVAMAFGASWQVGLACGMTLSLSSTAIVLQTLQERGLLKSTGGEVSFSVLLFQDIAVIPILALFPLLAPQIASGSGGSSGALQALKIAGGMALVIVAGRTLVRPVFRLVAQSNLRELFTALALVVVLATAALMHAVDLSPALGAFLAGVVLAESEYRHQLETDIEPFKGILLAIFFISVGAGIDFSLFSSSPGTLLLGVLGLLVLKAALLFAVARLTRLAMPDALLFAAALAQGGEFAFVLLGYGQKVGLFTAGISQLVTAIVALSMALAPLMILGVIRFVLPRFEGAGPKRETDTIDERENPVLIVGVGRFGQMVARILRSTGYRVTVLDYDADQVDLLRKFGLHAFYGDASRPELLESAGIAQARVLVLALDQPEKTTEIIEWVRAHHPKVRIFARVFDRVHAYEVIHRGVDHVYIETAGSALNLARDALEGLGMRRKQAHRLTQLFWKTNERAIRETARMYHEADEATLIRHTKGWLEQLEKTLQSDLASGGRGAVDDRGWESAPRPDIKQ